MRRAIVAVALAVTITGNPHPAERTLFILANHARVSHAEHTVRWAPTLHKIARAWSIHLALFHHLADPERIYCAYQGANVGIAPSAKTLHAAWMASPAHRANILDPVFRRLGVGTTRDAQNYLWGTEIFCG